MEENRKGDAPAADSGLDALGAPPAKVAVSEDDAEYWSSISGHVTDVYVAVADLDGQAKSRRWWAFLLTRCSLFAFQRQTEMTLDDLSQLMSEYKGTSTAELFQKMDADAGGIVSLEEFLGLQRDHEAACP